MPQKDENSFLIVGGFDGPSLPYLGGLLIFFGSEDTAVLYVKFDYWTYGERSCLPI